MSEYHESSLPLTHMTMHLQNNAAVEKIVAKEKALGDNIKFEDIIEEVAGVYPKVMIDGDVNAGIAINHHFWIDASHFFNNIFKFNVIAKCFFFCHDFFHDIPTCDELVNRIVKDAEDIIRGRLLGLL
jgi:hypothetical protein